MLCCVLRASALHGAPLVSLFCNAFSFCALTSEGAVVAWGDVGKGLLLDFTSLPRHAQCIW
eukprot:6008914-Amphidinium_carterae.1